MEGELTPPHTGEVGPPPLILVMCKESSFQAEGAE